MKPRHPETFNLLCEVVAETDNERELVECVDRAAGVFDNLNEEGVSRTALSSVYGRLAKTCISVSHCLIFMQQLRCD